VAASRRGRPPRCPLRCPRPHSLPAPRTRLPLFAKQMCCRERRLWRLPRRHSVKQVVAAKSAVARRPSTLRSRFTVLRCAQDGNMLTPRPQRRSEDTLSSSTPGLWVTSRRPPRRATDRGLLPDRLPSHVRKARQPRGHRVAGRM